MRPPAHKTFIERYLDWERVRDRLSRYPHLREQYPIKLLESCSSSRPYYCHYLAWRLGSWENSERLFEFFDDLFACGASLKDWKSKKSQLRSCSFDDFWGLIWELQIAKLLSDQLGINLEWMNLGPDLKGIFENETFFVECYTYRKSFGIEEFIEELFSHIHPHIKVSHGLCTPFNLPNDANKLDDFLNALFEPYLDPAFMEEKIRQSQDQYPILLPTPDSANNLYVYLENNDPANYVPGRVPNPGNTEVYLEQAIKEAINNKREENNLKNHRPNLLAINYLLGRDFQLAKSHALDMEAPHVDFGSTLDAVLFAVCGIDEMPTKDNCHMAARDERNYHFFSLFI